jgi:hypothetical protein
MDKGNLSKKTLKFFKKMIKIFVCRVKTCGRIRIRIQSDPYIIGSSGSGSGSSSLKTDHKFKHLEYFMTFLKICLKSFQIFSSVLKEFLHNQSKYDINWNIKKKL